MFRNKNENDPVQQQINLLLKTGADAQERGDLDAALETYRHGLSLARLHGLSQFEQVFLNSLGAIYAEQKRFDEAEQHFHDALQLANRLQQPVLVARSQNNMGELFAAQKEWAQAQQYHEKALEVARPTGDATTIVLSLENLARDYLEQDNPSYAIRLLKEAVTVAQAQQNIYLGAGALGRLGEALLASGDKAAGRKLLEQALRLSQQIGRNRLTMRCLINLAELDTEEKHYHSALQRYQAAEDLVHRVGTQSPEIYVRLALNMSEAFLHLGNYEPALAQAERAILHASELDDKIGVAKATGHVGLALQGLARHDEASAKLQEGLTYYDDGTLDDENEHARLLLALGRSQQNQGDTDGALITYQHVLESTGDDPLRRAEALQMIGALHATRLERDESIKLYQEAQQLYEQAKETHRVARTLCDIGSVRRAKGDFNGALTDFENALVLLNHIEDRITRGLVFSNAAVIYTETGDIETARSFFEEAIKLAQDTNDSFAESVRLGNLGWLYIATGKTTQAIETLEKAIGQSRSLNDPLLLAIQTSNLGWAYHQDNDDDTALNLLNQALVYAEQADSVQWRGFIKSNLGAIYLAQQELDRARTLLDEALADSESTQTPENIVRTQTRKAELLVVTGQLAEAQQLAQEAEMSARRMPYRKGHADASRVLGDIYDKLGQGPQAQAYYQEALRLYKMIQDPAAQQLEAMIIDAG